MNDNIQRLRECTTFAQAEPYLNTLRAGPAARKLMEISILLKSHADSTQRHYGEEMFDTAIKELDPKEQPTPAESPGVKVVKDKIVQEELLSNNNPSSANTGSEQSTKNTAPTPKEGTTEPNSDIESMQTASGENQMTEMIPGLMGENMGMLDPKIAAMMGQNMPQPPPMSTPQQMQQMQYTVKQHLTNYHNKVVKPVLETNKHLMESVGTLSKQIREIEASNGKFSMDLNKVKREGPRNMQETIPIGLPTREVSLIDKRSQIMQLDQSIREQNK